MELWSKISTSRLLVQELVKASNLSLVDSPYIWCTNFISNLQQLDCSFNTLFRVTKKKGLNSATREIPAIPSEIAYDNKNVVLQHLGSVSTGCSGQHHKYIFVNIEPMWMHFISRAKICGFYLAKTWIIAWSNWICGIFLRNANDDIISFLSFSGWLLGCYRPVVCVLIDGLSRNT